MTFVKICGIRTVEHARAALEAGADFLGFVFYRPSHRYLEPEAVGEIVAECRATFGGPERWQAVGIFVDEPVDVANAIVARAGLDLAQLCGSEDREYGLALRRPAVRVVHVPPDGGAPSVRPPAEYGAVRLMLDTGLPGHYGGTGTSYRWDAVRDVAVGSFLAGGLTPANVGDAIRAATPWAVDVSSGVERDRVKDPDLIRQFVREVRRADRDGS